MANPYNDIAEIRSQRKDKIKYYENMLDKAIKHGTREEVAYCRHLLKQTRQLNPAI